MNRRWIAGLVVAGLMALLTGAAPAEAKPGSRRRTGNIVDVADAARTNTTGACSPRK